MNIVITGASRGIGYQTALHLSETGKHRIFALSRDSEKLNKLTLATTHLKSITAIQCNLEEEESISLGVLKISKEVNSIDVLINNSGRLINKPFLELTSHDWKMVYGVNVFGVAGFTKALMPLLKNGSISENGKTKSHIVNISSMGGIQGSMKFAGLSAYSSSKGALITMTECMSEEFKEEGIRVNCVALGSVETEMFKEAFPGVKASMEAEDISIWLSDFALNGYKYFNGKVIPVSTSTP